MTQNQDSIASRPKKQSGVKKPGQPEAITLPWLIRHMTIGGWITFFGILSAVFFGGYKIAFLPIAENFGLGIQNEIVRLESLNRRLNSKLSELNLSLSNEIEKTNRQSNELASLVSENDALKVQSKKLKLDLNTTKSLFTETERQHRKALEKMHEAESMSVQTQKVIPENLVISKNGEPWISPSYDITLTLIRVNSNNTVTFQATPWKEYASFSVGDMFELSTSSGLYRFIVMDTQYYNGAANLKVLKVNNIN